MIRYIKNEQGRVDVMRGQCHLGQIIQLPIGVMFVTHFTNETADNWDELIERIEHAHTLPSKVEVTQ